MNKDILQYIYYEYSREIYLYLYSLCHNQHLAEDLMQETFVKAFLSLPNVNKNIRAWLYMVARNLFFNHYRREKVERDFLKSKGYKPQGRFNAVDMQNVESEHSVLDYFLKKERYANLYKGINMLDFEKREVLVLQYFSGFSQKEISGFLKITLENVRVLAHRGKKELKKYLKESDYEV